MNTTWMEDFVRAHTEPASLPLLPELTLHLGSEVFPLWRALEAIQGSCDLPYWAFAWSGGQALARFVLDRPDVVADRHVVDLAAGSGLVGIAAALSGAAGVTALDVDDVALTAVKVNAGANGASIETRKESDLTKQDKLDVVLAGDVFYERQMATAMIVILEGLASRGIHVYIGDPGRKYLPRERLEHVAEYDVPVMSVVEEGQIKHCDIWTFR